MAEVNSNTNETNVNNDVAVENETTTVTNDSSKDNSPSIESLMAEIASLKSANKKQKSTIDKLCSEAAENKRQQRAKMSAQEQEEEARREAEEARNEEMNELKAFKSKTLAKERYLLQGMDVDLATKAADAEIEGNMDELSAIQKQYSDAKLKAEKSKWLASRPEVNAGGGSTKVTKEQFDAMNMVELTQFKRENPDEYYRLASL